MQMTDTEILGKYNRSDDKKGVVQILADLNGCDKDTIQQILIQGGVPESEFAPKKRRKRQPPAPKPDPAKATAAMPPEDESLPIPFSDDDMGIGDDEYGGAMTGARECTTFTITAAWQPEDLSHHTEQRRNFWQSQRI